MSERLRTIIGYVVLVGTPLALALPALLLPPETWVDWFVVVLLWLGSSLGSLLMLHYFGFWSWVTKGPQTRIIIPRPCRCGMAFPARDRLFHLVERESDLRLRLACTGGDTGLMPFYVLGKKGRTVTDVPLSQRCPRPGCARAFEADIHPACPQHGHHRIEPA